MATSLGRLLDTLADAARVDDPTPTARADAAGALGQLGRALAQLRRDGVSSAAGDLRERQVAALAAACTQLAVRAPAIEGSRTALAAAAADTLAVLHEQTSVASRWASAVAVAETVTPLVQALTGELPAGPAAQWLAEIERQSVFVQQTAALQPPARADAAILDRPLPGRVSVTATDPADVVPDAVATLLRASATAAGAPSVSEVLAYTLAAETLSRTADRLSAVAPAETSAAALSWRAVRVALRPYDDGSRRPHAETPPAVQAALRLHAALGEAGRGSEVPVAGVRSVVAAAAQHLPALATQLMYRTVRSWADTGALLAYARDVPPREDRVAAYLRGYRPGGLVRVDAVDLQPVVGALHNARLLSLAVATRAAAGGTPAMADFPRRVLAANQALFDQPQTAAALATATREAGRLRESSRPSRTSPTRTR